MTRRKIYLTSAEVQGVARIAASTGRKQSEVIREAIDQYLLRLGPQDRLSRLREASGLWSDRTIELKDLRKDYDRF